MKIFDKAHGLGLVTYGFFRLAKCLSIFGDGGWVAKIDAPVGWVGWVAAGGPLIRLPFLGLGRKGPLVDIPTTSYTNSISELSSN